MRDVSNILYGKSKNYDDALSPKSCVCTETVSHANENPAHIDLNENVTETKKDYDDSHKICVNVNVDFSKWIPRLMSQYINDKLLHLLIKLLVKLILLK